MFAVTAVENGTTKRDTLWEGRPSIVAARRTLKRLSGKYRDSYRDFRLERDGVPVSDEDDK